MENTPCVIGEGIQIRGHVSGSGGLVVRGRVEGAVALSDHFTVEPTGTVLAQVEARSVTVDGNMQGDIAATESVVIAAHAELLGDVRTAQVQIDAGARFRGRLEMDVPLPDGLL